MTRGLPPATRDDLHRTRRWDAVVVGGSLPGLAAAVRIGMNGSRVLVVEEPQALAAFHGLREPFLMNDAEGEGVLARCLQELGIALIDRRRVEREHLSYQVVLPDARTDVGDADRTAEELVAWRLASPDEARRLVRGLADAAEAEREALLSAPVTRGWRTLPLHAPQQRAEAAEGLLARWLDAQLRALHHLATAAPPPGARARLLGAALAGATVFTGGEFGLRGLLRRRIRDLHGEFRELPGRFRLLTVAGQPGLALEDRDEIWAGRALVLNAPRAALAAAAPEGEVPELLLGPAPVRRRLALHFRVTPRALPEGMAPRVICVRDPGQPLEGTNVVALRVLPARPGRPGRSQTGAGRAGGESAGAEPRDLVASAVIDADESDPRAREAEIESAVVGLMPFADGELVRPAAPDPPHWDRDDWLFDPPSGARAGDAGDLRLSSRPPVYALERAGLAALGFEGDLLLGWRAGDAIASDLP